MRDLPNISGLTVRRLGEDSDYQAIAEVLQACLDEDGIDSSVAANDIQHHYAHVAEFDRELDVLLLEVAGRIVAFGDVDPREEGTGLVVFLHGFVSPEFRRRGLGRTLMTWGEQRSAEIARAKGRNVVCIHCRHPDMRQGAHILLAQSGFEAVRRGLIMTRSLTDIPQINVPAGISVEPFAISSERAAWQAFTESFRDHWGFVEPAETDFDAWRTDPDRDPSLMLLARDERSGEIAGGAFNAISAEDNARYATARGWTAQLFVRRPWRRRGLARILLAQSLRLLAGRGMQEAALGVDAENLTGALRLYESVGYRVLRSSTVFRKWLTLDAHVSD